MYLKSAITKTTIKTPADIIQSSKDLHLEGDTVFINAKKFGTIKMGDPRAVFVPTVRGDILLQFQSDILTLFSDFQQVLLLIATPPAFIAKAKSLVDKIMRMTEVITKQTFLNKQVMTADPNIKIPDLPKIPEPPEIPDISDRLPKKPSLDNLKKRAEELL